MQYMLCFRETDAESARRTSADAPAYWGAWSAYIGAMRDEGIMISGNALEAPHTGTVVRVLDGQRQVVDGPFADSKESLGGYCIIEVPDLDAALIWAARCPSAAAGSVEVRPVLVMAASPQP